MAGPWRFTPLVKSQKPSYQAAKNLDAAYQEYIAETQYNLVELLPILLTDCYDVAGVCGKADYHRDKATMLNRLGHEGVSFVTKILPGFFDSVVQELETGTRHYPGFSLDRDGRPKFLRKLTSLVFADDSNGREVALKVIYQLCYAFKKLKGPYPHTVLLDHVKHFVEVDKEIGNIDLWTPELKEILQHAQSLVTKLFMGFTMDMVTSPHPGPGATNTPVEKHMRYKPHVLYKKLHDVFEYHEWFYSHPWDVVTSTAEFLSLIRSAEEHATARFKHVHKTLGKPRGICIEQNEMQWIQQGVKDALVSWLESHPITKGFINFTDQSVNQSLALESSSRGYNGTIDMSDASDRILRCLVLFLFMNTELFDALAAASTPVIEFPPEYGMEAIECNKYAPMGSGLCFPTMAVVHWALIRSIMYIHCRKDRSAVYVYGDDIILPSACCEAVFTWLPCFGMKVNKTKSFYRSQFRESCGVHAYNGVDITPVFIKKIPTFTLHSKADLLTYIAQERDLFAKGYVRLAAWIRQNSVGMPFVGANTGHLGWLRDDPHLCMHPSTYAVKRRYNKDLQRVEFKVQTVRSRTESLPPLLQHEGYLRKLTQHVRENILNVDGCSDDQVIHWSWVPITDHSFAIRPRLAAGSTRCYPMAWWCGMDN